MLDIKFVRENPEVVKQNIRNKFQDNKLELVDKVLELDKENREIKQEVEALRAERNKLSKQIGALMGQGKKEEAEEVKKQVAADAERLESLAEKEKELNEKFDAKSYAKAFTNEGEDITESLKVESNVDTTRGGNYEVKYIITENNTNIEKIMKVEVVSDYDYLSDFEWKSATH